MIVQNSQPKKIRRSNKIRKIIKDGIVLNFRTTNDLIKKYGDNSKQIKRTNYTKYITKGNNYFYLKYLKLRNIDVLYNFCSKKGQSVLIDLKKKLNNDNELIKHFDNNFAIFLLENKFPFSKKFKELHNYNYINDNKYFPICLDVIDPEKKSKEKSEEIKIFSNLKDNLKDNSKNKNNNNNKNKKTKNNNNNNNNLSNLDNNFYLENEFIGKKRIFNEKNSVDKNIKSNLTEKKTNDSLDSINIDNIFYIDFYNVQQNQNNDIFSEKNFGNENFFSDDEEDFI